MTDDAVPVRGSLLPRLSPEAAKAMAQVACFIDTTMRTKGFDAIAGKAG
jgi:hypothetical protein